MTGEDIGQRISNIPTLWSVLQLAHTADAQAEEARQLLVVRYGGAVRRYLLAALRDEHAADDLAQEFALALVRGEFRHAEPARGRFRDYVKGVLFHLISRYRKRAQKVPQPAGDDAPLANLAAPEDDPGKRFDQDWREELLARTWNALRDAQPAWYAALRYRAEHPEQRSEAAAEGFSRQEGRPVTAAAFRQNIHRARERFAILLCDEVARSLRAPSLEEVKDELRDLDLLSYCKDYLDAAGR